MQMRPGNRSKSFQDGIQLQNAQKMQTSEIEEATATASCPGRLTGTSTWLIGGTMDRGKVYFTTSENIELEPNSFRALITAEDLGQLTRNAARGQRKHQARDSAEEHADPHKRPNDPFSARWPGPPNHDGKDQGDYSVD